MNAELSLTAITFYSPPPLYKREVVDFIVAFLEKYASVEEKKFSYRHQIVTHLRHGSLLHKWVTAIITDHVCFASCLRLSTHVLMFFQHSKLKQVLSQLFSSLIACLCVHGSAHSAIVMLVFFHIYVSFSFRIFNILTATWDL